MEMDTDPTDEINSSSPSNDQHNTSNSENMSVVVPEVDESFAEVSSSAHVTTESKQHEQHESHVDDSNKSVGQPVDASSDMKPESTILQLGGNDGRLTDDSSTSSPVPMMDEAGPLSILVGAHAEHDDSALPTEDEEAIDDAEHEGDHDQSQGDGNEVSSMPSLVENIALDDTTATSSCSSNVSPASNAMVCLVCGVECIHSTAFEQHHRLQHKSIRFKCSLCEETSYTMLRNLGSHVLKKHGREIQKTIFVDDGSGEAHITFVVDETLVVTGQTTHEISQSPGTVGTEVDDHEHEGEHDLSQEIDDEPEVSSIPSVVEDIAFPLADTDGNSTCSSSVSAASNAQLCLVCGVEYKSNADLEQHHRDDHADIPYKCTACQTTYSYRMGLVQHFQQKHVSSQRVCHNYKCPVCDVGHDRVIDLDGHIRHVHPKHQPYKCAQCDRAYRDKRSLTKHHRQKGHKGIASLLAVCQASSSTATDEQGADRLVNDADHDARSTGNDTVISVDAASTLVTVDDDVEHEDDVAIVDEEQLIAPVSPLTVVVTSDDGEQSTSIVSPVDNVGSSNSSCVSSTADFLALPSVCLVCGVNYPSARALKRHHYTKHSKKRPYKCTMCDKKYAIEEYLKDHLRKAHQSATSTDVKYETHDGSDTHERQVNVEHGDKRLVNDAHDEHNVRSTVDNAVVDPPTVVIDEDGEVAHDHDHNLSSSNGESSTVMRLVKMEQVDETTETRVNHNERSATRANQSRPSHGGRPSTEYSCVLCDVVFISRAAIYKHMTTDHKDNKAYRCAMCDGEYYEERHLVRHHREKGHEGALPIVKCARREATKLDVADIDHGTTDERIDKENIGDQPVIKQNDEDDTVHSAKIVSTVHDVVGGDVHDDGVGGDEVIEETERVNLSSLRSPTVRVVKMEQVDETIKPRVNHNERSANKSRMGPIFRQKPCPLCSLVCASGRVLLSHMHEEHAGERPYKCDRCDADYVEERVLKEHVRKKHGVRMVYPAKIRGGEATNENVKVDNVAEDKPSTPTVNSVIDLTDVDLSPDSDVINAAVSPGITIQSEATSASSESDTMEKATTSTIDVDNMPKTQRRSVPMTVPGSINVTVACPYCTRSFGSVSGVNWHIDHHHPGRLWVSGKPFKCTQCGLETRLKVEMQEHINEEHKEAEVASIGTLKPLTDFNSMPTLELAEPPLPPKLSLTTRRPTTSTMFETNRAKFTYPNRDVPTPNLGTIPYSSPTTLDAWQRRQGQTAVFGVRKPTILGGRRVTEGPTPITQKTTPTIQIVRPVAKGPTPTAPDASFDLPCPHCTMKYPTPKALINHVALDHVDMKPMTEQEAVFKCEKCKYTSNVKFNLMRHLKSHNNEVHILPTTSREHETSMPKDVKSQTTSTFIMPTSVEISCLYCPKTYGSRHHLNRHIRRDHQGRADMTSSPFNCHLCKQGTGSMYDLKRHIMRLHKVDIGEIPSTRSTNRSVNNVSTVPLKPLTTEVNCPYCEEVHSSRSAVNSHITAKHAGSQLMNVSLYKCSKCSYKGATKGHLSQHLSIKHKQTNIPSTSPSMKLFGRSDIRGGHDGENNHMRTATREGERSTPAAGTSRQSIKRFQCPLCPKTCVTRKDVQKHADERHAEEDVAIEEIVHVVDTSTKRTFDESALSDTGDEPVRKSHRSSRRVLYNDHEDDGAHAQRDVRVRGRVVSERESTSMEVQPPPSHNPHRRQVFVEDAGTSNAERRENVTAPFDYYAASGARINYVIDVFGRTIVFKDDKQIAILKCKIIS